MNSRKYNIYQFPECKDIVVSGDIHGDFNLLVNKICVQYQMRNTLVIVAGDCGFGFDKRGYYDNMVKRNAKRMNDANKLYSLEAIMTTQRILMGKALSTNVSLPFQTIL